MSSRTTDTISKTLYQIVLFSFLGILTWVGWGIYQAMVNVPKPQVDAQILAPVTVDFDDKTLEQITTRLQLTSEIDNWLSQYTEPKVATPSPDYQ